MVLIMSYEMFVEKKRVIIINVLCMLAELDWYWCLLAFKNVLSNLSDEDKSNFLLMALNSSLMVLHNLTIPTNTSESLNVTDDEKNICNFDAINVSKYN